MAIFVPLVAGQAAAAPGPDDASPPSGQIDAYENAESVAVLGVENFVAEDNEVIVEVYLRRKDRLSDGIIAYMQGKDLLVPLNELMILLEFAIERTPNGGAGWFLAEDRRFSLDLRTSQVVSDGRHFRLTRDDARVIGADLFVSTRRLSEWLPLNFVADLRSLTLTVEPREPVPLEQRRAREKRDFGSIRQFRSRLPHQHTDYAMGQIPGMEVDLTSGYSDHADAGFFGGGTLRAFGDFLYMNGELFVTGNDNDITDARIRLGRADPDGGLLGPLNATEWAIGDVGSSGVPLVSRTLSGRGARLTSRPFSYVAEFDRITLEESLPVGYEVELYRNGILISAYGPSPEGRYRFEDVPLLRGQNELRLEFYGPQGQRRTETHNYHVGGLQVPVGSLNYDVTLHEVGRSVFGFSDWVADNDDFEDFAFGGSARFDYGLTRNLSVTGGVAAAPLPIDEQRGGEDEHRLYGTLGARTQVAGVSLNLDSAIEDTGGVALGIGAQTTLYDWNLSLRHEEFLNDFASLASLGVRSKDDDYAFKTSHSVARLDTSLRDVMPDINVNFGFSGGYTAYDGREPTWEIGNSIGISAGIFSLGNDIRFGRAFADNGDELRSATRINMRVFDGLSLRATADYGVWDAFDIGSLSAGLTAALPYDVGFNLGYSNSLDDEDLGTQSYYASLYRKFGMVDLGLVASFDHSDDAESDQGFRIAMTAAFSTFTDPATLETSVTSNRIARRGAIRARAYHDANGNGIRDAGEELVPNAKVLFAGQRTPYYTGDKQAPVSEPLGAGRWVDVALDATGLPDPAFSPGTSGTAVLPRPSVVSEVELPVISTAGLEGHVSLKVDEDMRNLPNMKVQIVRRGESGEQTVIAEASTEFDGLFSLSQLPIGTYTVRVAPEQARQIGVNQPVEREITLTHDTGVLDGIDLVLTRIEPTGEAERSGGENEANG